MDATNAAQADNVHSRKGKAIAASMVVGFLAGVVIAGVVGWTAMPGMMIVTEQSRVGVDVTLAARGKAHTHPGWV